MRNRKNFYIGLIASVITILIYIDQTKCSGLVVGISILCTLVTMIKG
ncbi:MAG: hypothetical protein ACI32O_11690 [Enterococcus sp.]|nr:hypothetical protein [Enterococcus sp. 10A9_DIV0425]